MTTDDEPFPLLEPDDLSVQRRYLEQLEQRFPDETATIESKALQVALHEGLKTCRQLRINDPQEIQHFLALVLLLTPAQKESSLLTAIVYRVLMAVESWGARKRLRFIYKFIVGRPPPNPEPDLGTWFIAESEFYPAVTLDDLRRSIFNILPAVAR